tara:strand:- start:59 stop:2626 length:2568 start_codon:yes stop_codon:yes gene_type:complete
MKNKNRSIYFFVTLVFWVVCFLGCSTQKDALVNRMYHQINTKYNGVFYANIHLEAGIKKITSNHKDNYKEILSINTYGDLKTAKTAQSSLDKAIEKSTLAIKQHSMDIAGDEKNKLVDDAYLIIGKAKFYKQEYISAVNTFNYIIRKSKNTETQSEAAIWSTLCQQELNNKESLRQSIIKLEEDYYLSGDQEAVLFEIKAELAIKEKNYERAQDYIFRAIKQSKNQNKKTRCYYILGQISVLTQDYNNAMGYFDKVIKKNPKYDMVFSSKLKKANSFLPGSDDFDALKKDLDKMLKDKKNKEYQDQIYFVLGSVEMRRNDTVSAIYSFEKSAQVSLDNNLQKTDAHYILANIFWNQKSYIKAYNHCDSASQLIESKDQRNDEIKNMLRSSKKIADLYNTINYNDSIILLARLPEKERNQIIDDFIQSLKKQEEQNKQESMRGSGGGRFNSYEFDKQAQNNLNMTSGGGWYFYNPSAISLGYSEFLSRWGNRKLEDNWRRKNKNQIINEEILDGENSLSLPDEKEKYSRDYYISQLPIDEEEQLRLFSKIETAYYDLSGVFKEDIGDYDQSIELYNQLMTRFPSTDYRQLIYFDLYNIYNLKNDTLQSKLFLDKIELEYPESNFLQILQGEGPMNSQYAKDKDIYEQAHDLYVEFTEKSCEELHAIFASNPQNKFIAQIELLNAFCQAKKEDKKAFILTLEQIQKKHPETMVYNKIDTIVSILKGEVDSFLPKNYQNTFEDVHYFFLLLNDISINIPETQRSISTFNNENFKLDSLQISNLLLNKNNQLLKVENFKNKEDALIYYELLHDHEATKLILLEAGVTPFVISRANFTELLKKKDINSYREYFNAIYLLN